MAKRRGILVSTVFLSIAIFTFRARSQTASANPTAEAGNRASSPVVAKVAHNLTVRWRSVAYKKTRYNPAFDRGQLREDLSVSCVIGMSDSRRLLGIGTDPVVEKITDSQGRSIEIGQGQSQPPGRYFEGPLMKRWLMSSQNTARSAGGARDYSRRVVPGLDLDAGLRERVGGEMALLKGHYTGLLAESIEYFDVPFRPDNKWVRLTGDVEIRVIKARNSASMHQYEIEQRPEIALSSNRVREGDPLPSRLVVNRQIIARNNTGVSGGGGGGRIGGSGSGLGRAEGIRFVIAVNPAHVKIPFEFQNIPLSAPAMQHSQTGTAKKKGYEAEKTRKQVNPPVGANAGKYYKVDWHSIVYSLNLYNPAVLAREPEQKLSVRCEARILDPKLIVGACYQPIIERITDASGQDTDISRTIARPDRLYYSPPAYRRSRTMTPPSALARLEGKARSALELPLRRRNLPTRNSEVQPVGLTIQLDPALMSQDHREVGQIKGYFHALTAESYKNIQVPFKPSNKWVRLTSDVQIQVARAWRDGARSRYDIRERSQAQIRPGRLLVDQPLPDGIVVDRQFVAARAPKRSAPVRSSRPLPVPAGGNGSVGRHADGIDYYVTKIDYRIAVRPTHHEIPFQFEHIPLP